LNTLLVALGGGLGAVSRYLLSSSIEKSKKPSGLPVAIIFVNIIGAGGLGLFLGQFYQTIAYNFYTCSVYLCFGVGFFGAFTTFSTFSLEAVVLLQQKDLKNFLLYLFFTVAGSLAAFSAGFLLRS
jgi:fluoride exporter